jgi:hypothetical protein
VAPENGLDAQELSEVNASVSHVPVARRANAGTVASSGVSRCPFHDGPATLDLLLAELDTRETELFDVVLDLRSLCSAGEDADACVAQLFRVRALLDGRHYLAFYRVRCWARRAFRLEVRAGRDEAWSAHEFPLDGGRLEEVINAALAPLAFDGVLPATARVRFRFATR